jgi:hypothetical protein
MSCVQFRENREEREYGISKVVYGVDTTDSGLRTKPEAV